MTAQTDGSASRDWHVVCVAPCTRRLPLDETYRAAGSDFAPSEPFHLPSGTQQVTVTSRVEKNRAKRTIPLVLTGTGLAACVLIGPLWLLGDTLSLVLSDESTTAAPPTGPMVLIVGGAAMAAVGVIWLLAVSGDKHSVVRVASRSTSSLKLSRGLTLDSRGMRF